MTIRQPTETQLEQKHRDIAKAHGWFIEKIMKTGRSGFPDRFYAKNKRVVLIEWKRPGKILTPTQRLRHSQLTAAGVEVHTVHSIVQANKILGIVM